jgi:hypothetical protein
MAQSNTVIAPDVIKELQQHIADTQPKTMGPDVRQGFCNTWPAARDGLEGLRTVLSFVPGVSVLPAPLFPLCWPQAKPQRELCAKPVDTGIGQCQSARRLPASGD